MPRKKPPPLIEVMENASFSFRCKSGHEFSKTGAWLRRNLIFVCPKCSRGREIVHTENMVQQLVDDRIDRLRKLIDQGSAPTRNGNYRRSV
jgi:hypothetical protein